MQIMLYSLHGQSKDALAKTKLGAWEYDIKGTYYKCNMTDIMASIGLVQLKRYPVLLKRRRDIIERYTQGIAADDVDIMKHFTDEYTSSGHLYLVRLLGKDVKERNELRQVLQLMYILSRFQCIRHIRTWDLILRIFHIHIICIVMRLHFRFIRVLLMNR